MSFKKRLIFSTMSALLCACAYDNAMPSGGIRLASLGAHATKFKMIYSFQGVDISSSSAPGDGANPEASLIAVNGNLYGTTTYGGMIRDYEEHGLGTVFGLSPSGVERILYRFAGQSDGAFPQAPLIYANGVFYGTTTNGGNYFRYGNSKAGDGVLFSLSASGSERILHEFEGAVKSGSDDGSNPVGGLLHFDNQIFGTTANGGSQYSSSGYSGGGTVFVLGPTGKVSTLYVFRPGDQKNQNSSPTSPAAGLIPLNRLLYGTTAFGGDNGLGTVFKLSTSGKEHIVYSFKGAYTKTKDGATPQGELVALEGSLYGTTVYGGAYGNGTVFVIDSAGNERILHSFKGGADGISPTAGLLVVKGILYGTTEFGGAFGDGTIFKLTTSGVEHVLHAFRGSDGSNPVASLTILHGKLYGTTAFGGQHNCGTVFAQVP